MQRRRLLVVLASLFGSARLLQAGSTVGKEQQCSGGRTEWVRHVLARMQSIKPGMTRRDLKSVFTTEGGISTGLQRTYISRDCPYFKVDVEFHAIGRPERDVNGRVTLVENDGDIIQEISKPYLQFSVMD
jgi:hypothetical protein